MSGAAAAAPTAIATDALPVKKGKKKLLIIIAALAVLLAVGAGGAVFMWKKKAANDAAAEEAAEDGKAGDGHDAHAAEPVKADASHAPTFLPLDPFTVNLADREAERYAQVGITLELADAKTGDLVKAYMPAIRNNVLLALGAKTAAQLIERDGKLRMAAEIRREALRPLGYVIELPPEVPASDPAASAVPAPAPKKHAQRAKEAGNPPPITAVHFSNFIIQ